MAASLNEYSDIELWLLTPNNEVLDYRSTSEWRYRFKAGDTKQQADNGILDLISNGESEYCEFKKYIDLSDTKGSKAWEIDKTVCAFSNHKGGKLLIGVSDEAEVVGIEEAKKHYLCGAEEAAASYVAAITKRLRESLIKNQCFTCELVTLYGKLVVVVEVEETGELNYINQKKQAFIRRGASSRLMTPDEIQSFSIQSENMFHISNRA